MYIYNIIAKLVICIIWSLVGILNAPKKGKGRLEWYVAFSRNSYIPLVVQILCIQASIWSIALLAAVNIMFANGVVKKIKKKL